MAPTRTRAVLRALALLALLVEWDDVQDGANHVHCVWRDLERDHGADLLGLHRAREHARTPSDG